MLAKIALAALVGALSGIMAAASEGPPAAADALALYGARTLARVEAAWHAVRLNRAP
jgi:hypothetical protein